jgi:hypothetical protein
MPGGDAENHEILQDEESSEILSRHLKDKT